MVQLLSQVSQETRLLAILLCSEEGEKMSGVNLNKAGTIVANYPNPVIKENLFPKVYNHPLFEKVEKMMVVSEVRRALIAWQYSK
jgi:hypothetical protein